MKKITNFFDETLTALVLSITPFIASLVPAIFLFINLTRSMELHWAFAIPIAIAAEGIGIGAIGVYYRAKQFNLRYKEDKNHVSTKPPVISYVIYLTAIITTNLLLEAHRWQESGVLIESISKAALSLLGLSGALLVATNSNIQMVRDANARKPRSTAPKQATETDQNKTKQPANGVPKGFPKNGTTREKVSFLVELDQNITGTKLQKWVGVSDTRCRTIKREILSTRNKLAPVEGEIEY